MNYRSSSWTGRAHRRLDSAFGPYVSRDLHPMQEPARNGWGGWALAIALGTVLGVLCWFWQTTGG